MQTEDAMSIRVFLSYSRKDSEFVSRLAKALADEQCLVDYDLSVADPEAIVTGISAEDEWWKRLEQMIANAAVIIFVISPDSANSKVCDEEIAFAQTLSKRIIPILRRPVRFAEAPPRLSALNVKIDFSGDAEAAFAALGSLLVAIRRDIKWLRTGARLSAEAKLWDDSSRTSDHLVRGEELRQAEEWAKRRPASAPEHSELILAFLAASRAAEDESRTISEIEKARYLELVRLTRSMLEEELKIRESLPKPAHYGVAEELETETETVRSLLNLQNKWHPVEAHHIASTGASEGYAEVFRFPCCRKIAKDFLSMGKGDPPSRFRADGCQDIPKSIQHGYKARPNPFWSALVDRVRKGGDAD